MSAFPQLGYGYKDMSEMENDILSKGDRIREVDIYFSVKR